MIYKAGGFSGKLRRRRNLEGYIYVLPWMVGTLLFFCFPVYKTFMISCSKITSFEGLKLKWIGLENYIRIFTGDVLFIPNFLAVVRDTFINIPLIVIFALFIAVMVNKNIKLKGLFRGIFILPFLLGSGDIFKVVVGLETNGGITSVSQGILIPEPVMAYMGAQFTGFVQMFLDHISLIILKSPIQIIVFLGALQTIPVSLYESSKCDGATEWEMFWKITLPMVTPHILFNTIFTLVESFTDISNPVINSIMGAWFFDKNYEYTAAMGWVYMMFIVLVAAVIFFVSGQAAKKRQTI